MCVCVCVLYFLGTFTNILFFGINAESLTEV